MEQGQPDIEEAQPERDLHSADGDDRAGEGDRESDVPLPPLNPVVNRPVDTATADQEAAQRDSNPQEEANEIARRDLTAQQTMSYWTVWIAAAAVTQLALSALGIFLIWRTLRETRYATKAALISAEAAQETVKQGRLSTKAADRSADIQEESLRRLERPYLFIEFKRGLGAYSDGRWSVVYQIANWGRTPAILKSFYIRLAFSEDMTERTRSNGLPVKKRGIEMDKYEVIPPNSYTDNAEVFLESELRKTRWSDTDTLRMWLHFIFCYQDPTGNYYYEETLMRCNEGGKSFQIVKGIFKAEPIEP